MDERKKKKVLDLLNHLERTCRELREVLSEDLADSGKHAEPKAAFKADEVLHGIVKLGRHSAIEKLREMKQRELGELFLVAGGPSAEKTRPKEWLIERITWMVFDFERGHEAIRSMD